MNKIATLAIAGFASVASFMAHAANHEIHMLNSGKDGAMVFEPAYVKAAVGDTITFLPTQKGAHNSASIMVPEGAKNWKSAFDAKHEITVDKEGVYLYVCDPHRSLGMVGVIQVGNPTNLEAAKTMVANEEKKMGAGKGRFQKALDQVK